MAPLWKESFPLEMLKKGLSQRRVSTLVQAKSYAFLDRAKIGWSRNFESLYQNVPCEYQQHIQECISKTQYFAYSLIWLTMIVKTDQKQEIVYVKY